MKSFKEFFSNNKEPTNWLNWDSSHAAIRDKVKLPETNYLNYDGSFAAIRKESLKEEDLTPNVRWNKWTGSRMKPKGPDTRINNNGNFYHKSSS